LTTRRTPPSAVSNRGSTALTRARSPAADDTLRYQTPPSRNAHVGWALQSPMDFTLLLGGPPPRGLPRVTNGLPPPRADVQPRYQTASSSGLQPEMEARNEGGSHTHTHTCESERKHTRAHEHEHAKRREVCSVFVCLCVRLHVLLCSLKEGTRKHNNESRGWRESSRRLSLFDWLFIFVFLCVLLKETRKHINESRGGKKALSVCFLLLSR
jgi:hypothetical protein